MKKKKMDKKKKIIISISAVLAFLIILVVILKISQNKPINSKEEAKSLQSIVEFCECKFISSKESEEKGYSLDIYLEFKYSPYEDGKSKQPYYDVTIEGISEFLKYRNIRLIDKSRNLVIRVDTKTNSISKKYFNDIEESEYFSKLLSENTLENKKELKETKFDITSELQTLINNNWSTKNINFGEKTSTFKDYDIYFENGYRVRNINGRLFNIVFTNKFEKEVISNIKVGDSFEKVKKELGNNYIEQSGILEYMGKDLYVCFTANEISVYPRISYDYTQFEKLLEEYNNNKDFNSFMNKLTSLWPDYSYYKYDTDYCYIMYPLKGVRIYNSSQKTDGIQLYQEYNGSLKDEHKDYYQVYYNTNESLILKAEQDRMMQKSEVPDENGKFISKKYSQKSTRDKDGKIYNIAIFSIDRENPDSELSKDIYADKILWYDDENLIYSIKKQGIYMYNATTRKTKTIVTGTDDFNITNFDHVNKILTYDGKDVKIEL
ncbi:MAG: hypothetical protein UE116_00485 [Clostridia bacterium]|jgi:hypothetical protein|nr:hypothetical protein [Clostridia bacterium]